jgi:hypothetical protein
MRLRPKSWQRFTCHKTEEQCLKRKIGLSPEPQMISRVLDIADRHKLEFKTDQRIAQRADVAEQAKSELVGHSWFPEYQNTRISLLLNRMTSNFGFL